MTKIAIPILDDSVAPCFEVARLFMIAEIAGDQVISSTLKECAGCEGYGRVRFLFEHNIDILICSGIKAFYNDTLSTSGLKIMSGVSGNASDILNSFAAGIQIANTVNNDAAGTVCEIPHDDLVCWTRDLFESNGYRISPKTDSYPPFVDLIAELTCPVCQKAIRIAVCCGARTYDPDQEIREFHYLPLSDFQARVFVFPASAHIEKTCREYGVELINPDSREYSRDRAGQFRIPLLKNPIPGHEKAFEPLEEI
jgi:predicted Fe-Mo cluster-binding NifX family protein